MWEIKELKNPLKIQRVRISLRWWMFSNRNLNTEKVTRNRCWIRVCFQILNQHFKTFTTHLKFLTSLALVRWMILERRIFLNKEVHRTNLEFWFQRQKIMSIFLLLICWAKSLKLKRHLQFLLKSQQERHLLSKGWRKLRKWLNVRFCNPTDNLGSNRCVEAGLKKLNMLDRPLESTEIFSDHVSLCKNSQFIEVMKKFGDKGSNGSIYSRRAMLWTQSRKKIPAFIAISS